MFYCDSKLLIESQKLSANLLNTILLIYIVLLAIFPTMSGIRKLAIKLIDKLLTK